jgi:hypothetical protein
MATAKSGEGKSRSAERLTFVEAMGRAIRNRALLTEYALAGLGVVVVAALRFADQPLWAVFLGFPATLFAAAVAQHSLLALDLRHRRNC